MLEVLADARGRFEGEPTEPDGCELVPIGLTPGGLVLSGRPVALEGDEIEIAFEAATIGRSLLGPRGLDGRVWFDVLPDGSLRVTDSGGVYADVLPVGARVTVAGGLVVATAEPASLVPALEAEIERGAPADLEVDRDLTP